MSVLVRTNAAPMYSRAYTDKAFHAKRQTFLVHSQDQWASMCRPRCAIAQYHDLVLVRFVFVPYTVDLHMNYGLLD